MSSKKLPHSCEQQSPKFLPFTEQNQHSVDDISSLLFILLVHINCCDASQHPVPRNSTIGKATELSGSLYPLYFTKEISMTQRIRLFNMILQEVFSQKQTLASGTFQDAIKNNIATRDISNTWEVKLITIPVEIRDKIMNIPAKGMDKRSKNAVCTCKKRPHIKFCIFHKTFLH